MGMTIDDADTILSCERLDSSMGCGASDEDIDEALGVAIDTMRKYQQLQADYENRLKADLVAMLVRLENEIDGLRAYDDIETVDKCEEIIQQKIDKLKEDT